MDDDGGVGAQAGGGWNTGSMGAREGDAGVQDGAVGQPGLAQRVPHNLNISFQFVEGESLLMGMKGIAVSSGSACTSASLEPSYVLRALGLSDEIAHSSVRFSVGRYTTAEEIDRAIAMVTETVERLKAFLTEADQVFGADAPPPDVAGARRVRTFALDGAADVRGHKLTYTAKTLPSGLNLHPVTGLISGKPTRGGTFASVITVTNGKTAATLPSSRSLSTP